MQSKPLPECIRPDVATFVPEATAAIYASEIEFMKDCNLPRRIALDFIDTHLTAMNWWARLSRSESAYWNRWLARDIQRDECRALNTSIPGGSYD